MVTTLTIALELAASNRQVSFVTLLGVRRELTL